MINNSLPPPTNNPFNSDHYKSQSTQLKLAWYKEDLLTTFIDSLQNQLQQSCQKASLKDPLPNKAQPSLQMIQQLQHEHQARTQAEAFSQKYQVQHFNLSN